MLQLRALGGIELQDSEREELRALLAQPKRFVLLVYLRLAPPRGAQRRDRLISLFWPEQDTERARNALSQALFFLRRTLGAEIILNKNGDEIELNREQLWCDVIAFEEAVRDSRYADAIELYRGDFLAGLHVAEAQELERWIESERGRLAQLFAKALEALAEERERAGDYRGALLWWRRLANQDPYSARVAVRLMRALSAAGDRVGAIQHARIYETLIADDLESRPDPEVSALARALQAGAPIALPSAPRQTADDAAVLPPQGDPAPVPAKPSRPTISLWNWRRTAALIAACLVMAVGGVLVVRLRNARATPVIHSLAVLPFHSYSRNPGQDFLAESMTDAVITELARLPQLRVISFQSVLQFRDTKRSMPEIARTLGVDGIVEATLLQDGNQIRLNVQLVYTPTERHVWAQGYDRDAADLVRLEDEIADDIARQIHAAIAIDSAGVVRSHRHYDLIVQKQYIRGEERLLSRTPRDIEQAIGFFRQAVASDTTFAPGYAGLAEAFGLASDLGFMPQREAADSSRVYARRALENDSLLSAAHATYAGSLSEIGDFVGAEREFKRAIQLEPGNASAHHWYAMLLATLHRGDEAIRESTIATELDPTSVSYRTVASHNRVYFHAPRLMATPPPIGPQLDPSSAQAHLNLANRMAMAGKCDVALRESDLVKNEVQSNIRFMMGEARIIDRCKGRPAALAIMNKAKQLPDAHRQGLWIAMGFRTVGQLDSAFVWLDSTSWNVEQRYNFRTDSSWDSLRNDPRYQRVIRRMGL